MNETDINPYDLVAYPSRAYPSCHPDRLCVIGRLFGLATPDPRRCRVLEIACGGGGNLVPMARNLPDSEFVGIDLSARAIQEAVERIERFGVTNAAVYRCDIREIGPDLGSFDYILCHGVFSWVPEDVRDSLFAAIRNHLTATGVALVSYNTHPGWRLLGVARDIMRFHGERYGSPAERVEEARSFVRLAAKAAERGGGAWAKTLQEAATMMDSYAPGYYFHDFLAAENTPFLLVDFVRRARGHGLNYLGDAQFAAMMPKNLDADVRATLDGIAHDIVSYEQYLDLLRGTSFRRSLLCHGEAPLQRRIPGAATAGMHAIIRGRPKQPDFDPADPAPLELVTGDGTEISVGDALAKAAMAELLAAYPGEIPVPELVQRARRAIGDDGTASDVADIEELGSALIHCFAADLVDLVPRARHPLLAVTERPLADPYARALGDDGDNEVPNLRHEMIGLSRFDRELLGLCDGTRDHSEIVDGLVEAVAAGRLTVTVDDVEESDPVFVRASMQAALTPQLAGLLGKGLLAG